MVEQAETQLRVVVSIEEEEEEEVEAEEEEVEEEEEETQQQFIYIIGQAFPHSCANFKCNLHNTFFNFPFFVCNNLISPLRRKFCIFCLVIIVAGEV
jgi:hypothetical protein